MTQGLKANHRTNRLLAALEPDDFAALEPHLEAVSFPRGQVLYEPGDPIFHVYFPQDAVVSLVNIMEDGSSVEIGVFGREGVMGLLSALVTREAFGQYIVQMGGTASRILFERLNEVRNARPGLRQMIVNYGEVLLAQTFQTVACNAVHACNFDPAQTQSMICYRPGANCSRIRSSLLDRRDNQHQALTRGVVNTFQ